MWTDTNGASAFPEGSRIGNYTILRPLGAGGMAVVLLCEKAGIGGFKKKYVAKLIHPRLSDDETFVKMFLDEARLCARLTHPNIVQVFEIDEIRGVPFLVMEHVDGPSLSKIVRQAEREGPVHYGRMARILAGVCRGLHYAHTQAGETGPIIHRDVSLQNILVTTDGAAKLIDFGIAKAEGRLHETQAGTLKGKLQYMAPEQLKNSGPLSPASDIFAIGVCLYRATTGRHPFEANDEGGIIAARIAGGFPTPSRLRPDYPADLEAIVMASLREDPNERTGSAAELAGALEWFASQPPWSSDQPDVGRWISELFPGGSEQFAKLTAAELQTSSDLISRLTVHSQSLTTPQAVAPPPAQPRWMWPAVAGAAILAALLVGLAWVATQRSDPETTIVAPQTTSDDEAAAVYLDEAEAALGKHDYRLATQLLTRCSAMTITDPKLTVQLERIAGQAQREIGLGMAKRLVAMNQPDEALSAVRTLLDQDPNDADALALLDQIAAQRAAAEAPEAVAAAPSQAAVTPGSLTVRGPAGAALFVDDLRVGVLPIEGRSIRPGRHVLHVRQQGMESVERVLNVTSGQRIDWEVALTAAKSDGVATSELDAALADAEALDAAAPPELPPPPTAATSTSLDAGTAPEVASAPVEPVVAAAAAPPAPVEVKSVHYSELTIRLAPKPAYPDGVREQGDITCMARVTVDTSGRVADVTVSGCPAGFQESTMVAMKRSKFAPYTTNGAAIPVATTFPVKFAARR